MLQAVIVSSEDDLQMQLDDIDLQYEEVEITNQMLTMLLLFEVSTIPYLVCMDLYDDDNKTPTLEVTV